MTTEHLHKRFELSNDTGAGLTPLLPLKKQIFRGFKARSKFSIKTKVVLGLCVCIYVYYQWCFLNRRSKSQKKQLSGFCANSSKEVIVLIDSFH